MKSRWKETLNQIKWNGGWLCQQGNSLNLTRQRQIKIVQFVFQNILDLLPPQPTLEVKTNKVKHPFTRKESPLVRGDKINYKLIVNRIENCLMKWKMRINS